jgi:hypothetical protein
VRSARCRRHLCRSPRPIESGHRRPRWIEVAAALVLPNFVQLIVETISRSHAGLSPRSAVRYGAVQRRNAAPPRWWRSCIARSADVGAEQFVLRRDSLLHALRGRLNIIAFLTPLPLREPRVCQHLLHAWALRGVRVHHVLHERLSLLADPPPLELVKDDLTREGSLQHLIL